MALKELTRSRFPRSRLRRQGSLGIVQTFYAGLILSCLWACDAQMQQQQQQQYFLERPQNSSVREGQTATLRCKIGNQHGKSQWTKDGLALGYERNIPGYPRYTMIGDPALGEHHLRIENVTLQDDFEYQCQVGPLGEHKLIRADARLTVLVPPASVEIVEHAPGSRIEIRENEEYVLQCVVRNAKPAADIVWYKRNVELKTANREESITDGDRTKCFDTKSKITIRAQADDNDADYSCEARHPALAVPKRTSVSFSVLYPPGPPEIVGYTEEERVLMGQEVTLSCVSRGGNPLPQLVWYKNDVKVDFSYNSSGRESRNIYRFVADATDNNAKFRCEATNSLSSVPLKAEITLTVHFAPKTVRVTAPGEAKVGDAISLECATSNSNPEARLSWVLDGKPIKENGSRIATSPEGGWVSTSNLTTVVRSSDRNLTVSCFAVIHQLGQTIVDTKVISVVHPPQKPVIYGLREDGTVREGATLKLSCISMGGNPLALLKWYQGKRELKSEYSISGNVATSKLEITAKREDTGREFRCEATNPALQSALVETATLRIEFPPATVTVKARPEKLRPGQVTTLTCESSSSYPASKLSWWRNGAMIPGQSNSTSPGQHGGTISRSTLQLQAVPELDGASFICQATNDFRDVVVQDSVSLEVLYKPEFLQGSIYTVEVEEGKPAAINMTARGNPANVTYLWSRAGKSIGAAWDSSLAADRITASGPLLNVTLVRREDSGDFKCDATNSEGTNAALVRLNVLYGASIVKVRSHVMVSEGMEAFLECQATGNPLTEQTVKWRRAGFDMESRTQQTTDVGVAYLTVQRVTRDDFGAFECVAYNGIAEQVVEKTWLFVKYKPVMDTSPEFQKAAAEPDQLGKVVCRATGAPNITFNWTREGVALSPSAKYDMQTEQIDLITWQSSMYVRNVATSDYGPYDCIARNEMGFNKSSVMLAAIGGPDTPLALQVLNVSHEAVQLSWRPAFDGGLPQAYKIRYKQAESESYNVVDVFPPDASGFTVSGLALGTEYLFSVMAFNSRGSSNYTTARVVAKTSSEVPLTAQKPRDLEVKPGEMPKMLIIVVTMVGTALLVLNVALIACFVRRRHRKRLTKGPWEEGSLLPSAVSEAIDTSKIVIIAVSTAGSILLLVNIVLVTCYLLRKRNKKCMEEATSSEGGSSKSATIEMYAPSSYNETVNGETLSSISEKSESYSHNGSHSDYAHDDASKPAVSTYLIDQSDSQPPYGSYRVNGNHGQGTLNRTPKTVNFDMGDDNYIDTLRRNAYTHVNEPAYGKSRSHTSIAANPDSYYTTSPLGDQSRYVAFPPAPPSFSNGPLRYNALSESANNSSATATHSPYTPMGSLNIPAASAAAAAAAAAAAQHHPSNNGGYNSTGRQPSSLPMNLPLPLPLSMQSHGHYPHYPDGPASIESTGHFTGPTLAPVRSLETEGHLV